MLLSEKFRKNILSADKDLKNDPRLQDLYEVVEGMSDEDFKEYIHTNRAYFKQNLPKAVDEIEGFQGYVSEEPKWGSENIDYKKVTGSDDALSDEKFYSYDMKDMDYFGSKVGMTGKEFLEQMRKDKVAKDRKAIAHGEDEGGWLESPKAFAKNLAGATMNVLAPRSQEAIERGEEPSKYDIALDVGIDAAQALPVGKFTKLASTAKPLGIRSILTNAAVPVTQEVADAVVYDDENPRGNADVIDIAKGTAVNIATPRVLRRYGSEKWDEIGKNVTMKNVPYVRRILQKSPDATVTDIVTNKTGDVLYSNRQTPLPVVGSLLEKEKKEKETEREKAKNKEKAEKKFKGKYTTRDLLDKGE